MRIIGYKTLTQRTDQMKPLPFKCQCGAKFKVPENLTGVGKKGKCPKCNQVVDLHPNKADWDLADIQEHFGSAVAIILGIILMFVVCVAPLIILSGIFMLLIFAFGPIGVAILAAWLIAGVVCMCKSGMKQGFANWGGATAAVVVGGAVLFMVIGIPVSLIGGMMNSGSSMTKQEKFRAAYPDIQRTVDYIKQQEARGKFIGDGDGF